MSRLLNAVREAVHGRDPLLPLALVQDDAVPFIEIGGPQGPVSSVAMPEKPRPSPAEAMSPPRCEVKSDQISQNQSQQQLKLSYPRLAQPDDLKSVHLSDYLSVAFHDLSHPKSPRASGHGPANELIVLHQPDHPISLEYQTLRQEISNQLTPGWPQILLFTAAAAAAGTTTVVLNLAASFARTGDHRVLIIDANAPRPQVADRLALKATPGLVEVLSGQLPLAWAIQVTQLPNLCALTMGTITQSTPTLMGDAWPKLLPQFRQWFDWVLIDGGVWGELPERDAACPGADAVYLVTREADASTTEFEGLRGWVKQLGGLLRGYVSTRA